MVKKFKLKKPNEEGNIDEYLKNKIFYNFEYKDPFLKDLL